MARLWCRLEDLNPQPTDYKSVALPIELNRHIWWRMTGSNRRPSACKADALPAELILHLAWQRPTLTGVFTPTTIGAEKLNFRVRYGNGCVLLAIITRPFNRHYFIIMSFLYFSRGNFIFFIPSKLDNTEETLESSSLFIIIIDLVKSSID